MSKSYFEKMRQGLNDITECAICMDTMKDPRMIPCSHSFCLECLEKYGEEKKYVTGEEADCPLCRKKFPLTEGGFKELPISSFVKKLIDLKKIQDVKEQAKGSSCELCVVTNRREKATQYCIDCEKNICNHCSGIHKVLKSLVSHRVVPQNKKPSKEELLKMTVTTCDKHADQQVHFYCYDCDIMACMACFSVKHREHRYEVISDAVDRLSEEIECMVKVISRNSTQTAEAIKQLKDVQTEFKVQLQAARFEATKNYKEFVFLLDMEHRKMQEALNECEAKHSKDMETLKDDWERELLMLENFERYWNELKGRGSACDILQAASMLQGNAQELVEFHAKQNRTRDASIQINKVKVVVEGMKPLGENEAILGRIKELSGV